MVPPRKRKSKPKPKRKRKPKQEYKHAVNILYDLQDFIDEVKRDNLHLSKVERMLLQRLFAEWGKNAQEPTIAPLIKGLSSFLKD